MSESAESCLSVKLLPYSPFRRQITEQKHVKWHTQRRESIRFLICFHTCGTNISDDLSKINTWWRTTAVFASLGPTSKRSQELCIPCCQDVYGTEQYGSRCINCPVLGTANTTLHGQLRQVCIYSEILQSHVNSGGERMDTNPWGENGTDLYQVDLQPIPCQFLINSNCLQGSPTRGFWL